jgi:proteasome lid subunit RPN8/RPN11
LAAFYHSHPDHDAYFSAEDIAQATPFGEPSYPEALQIVLSVYGQEVRSVRAFAWSPAASSYVEVGLESD